MKRKISILLSVITGLIAGHTAQAQTALPYFTGFDNAAQKNGWQIIRKGATGTYNYTYSTIEPYSGTDCLYHDYPVGGTVVTDDWFVSPAFNLTTGGKLDSIRHSFSGFGVPGTGDTLAIYMLTGNADPALATAKVMLYDFRGSNYNNDNIWRQTSNINLPPALGSSYIAIRYKTINNWLTVKFDNVRIRANAGTGITTPAAKTNEVSIFPNPVQHMLHITSKANIKITFIADVNGRIIYRQPFSEKIDLSSFRNGVYVMTCVTAGGEQINKSFVKK